ncbi:MAG: hypothetical protein A3E79_00280 [Burkholderiales bacterium RIFCSPHIGHO2_12_FULL_61_11]|nr:MAG: hypothetical protein A3E79_00280 [Burkholderiales bacterium RIFCSPHIGHO2_12_FULL_61_11]
MFGASPTPAAKTSSRGLDPNSLKVVTAFVEPSLTSARADRKFQFERHGYFVADRVDHTKAKPVFNLAVGLKDSWGSKLVAFSQKAYSRCIPTFIQI